MGLADLEGAAAQVEGLEARVSREDLEVRRGVLVGCAAAAGAAAGGLAKWAGWAAGWAEALAVERAGAAAAAHEAATAAAAAMAASDKCVCLRGTLDRQPPPWRSTIHSCLACRILLCRPRPSTKCLCCPSLRATERSSVLACICLE